MIHSLNTKVWSDKRSSIQQLKLGPKTLRHQQNLQQNIWKEKESSVATGLRPDFRSMRCVHKQMTAKLNKLKQQCEKEYAEIPPQQCDRLTKWHRKHFKLHAPVRTVTGLEALISQSPVGTFFLHKDLTLCLICYEICVWEHEPPGAGLRFPPHAQTATHTWLHVWDYCTLMFPASLYLCLKHYSSRSYVW